MNTNTNNPEQGGEVQIPLDATHLECFCIKNGEAYIGFKISNGNFHFVQIPYTEHKSDFDFLNDSKYISEKAKVADSLDRCAEQCEGCKGDEKEKVETKYCPYCQSEQPFKHEWRDYFRCQTCFNKSKHEAAPEIIATSAKINKEKRQGEFTLQVEEHAHDVIMKNFKLQTTIKEKDDLIEQLQAENEKLWKLLEEEWRAVAGMVYPSSDIEEKWQEYILENDLTQNKK